ncbi:MAG TPA: carboxypeptidase regulatory-like domain-containing protein, partial [Kofleriaceae bacterium]|nr:carboxypeptidase regulatory-like domain-containing protein [Kofleriaceae bacterium]
MTDPATAPKRHLSGTVVQDGRGLRATVRAFPDGGGATPAVEVQTDDDGKFAFTVAAAEYWLVASAPGVARGRTRIDAREADRSNIAIMLHGCTRDLAGTITDSSGGAPIEAARIDGGWAVTDKDGRFRICDDNEQTEITAEADGFASESRHLMPGDTNVDFALTPEAPVSGIVVGPDRVPIADVRVRLNPAMHTASETRNAGGLATSGSDGQFVMHGLGAGTYEVWVRAPGFVLAQPVSVTLKIADNPQLVIPLRVADVVRGVTRVDGKPLAKAQITWMPEHGQMAVSTTQDDGTFEIRNTTYGRGMFAFEHHEPVRDVLVGPLPVTLDLRQAMEIRGHVMHDGAPVAGAEVSGAGIPTTSDETGAFTVQVVAAGTYPLTAVSELVGGFSADTPVLVKEGQVVEGVVLDIAFEASISGVVVDQSGAPIARAKVTMTNHTLGDYGDAITRGDGTFRAAKLSGGRGLYEATVTLDGRELAPVGGPRRTITVPGARSAITGERLAVMLRRSTIAGQVVDEAGAAVPDAVIESRGLRARSDADGRFTLSVIDGGTYYLQVIGPPGMQAFVSDVAPGTRDLRVVLRPAGSVHVTCPGAAADANIDVFTAGNTIEHAVVCGSTVNHVVAGLVTGRSRDGAIVAQAIVQPGRTSELVMQAPERRDVRVTVVHDGAPVANAPCYADYAPASYQATDDRPLRTSTSGVVTLKMDRLRGRVVCVAPSPLTWSPGRASVEPTATDVTVELQ